MLDFILEYLQGHVISHRIQLPCLGSIELYTLMAH